MSMLRPHEAGQRNLCVPSPRRDPFSPSYEHPENVSVIRSSQRRGREMVRSRSTSYSPRRGRSLGSSPMDGRGPSRSRNYVFSRSRSRNRNPERVIRRHHRSFRHYSPEVQVESTSRYRHMNDDHDQRRRRGLSRSHSGKRPPRRSRHGRRASPRRKRHTFFGRHA